MSVIRPGGLWETEAFLDGFTLTFLFYEICIFFKKNDRGRNSERGGEKGRGGERHTQRECKKGQLWNVLQHKYNWVEGETE